MLQGNKDPYAIEFYKQAIQSYLEFLELKELPPPELPLLSPDPKVNFLLRHPLFMNVMPTFTLEKFLTTPDTIDQKQLDEIVLIHAQMIDNLILASAAISNPKDYPEAIKTLEHSEYYQWLLKQKLPKEKIIYYTQKDFFDQALFKKFAVLHLQRKKENAEGIATLDDFREESKKKISSLKYF